MAKHDNAPKIADVGGQAVMEGVMMKGPTKIAIAVRRPDGGVAVKLKPIKEVKWQWLKWPLVRGVVNFGMMMYLGVGTLAESAEMAGLDAEEPSKFEKKLAGWFNVKTSDIMMTVAVILALALSIGLFFVVPTLVESWLKTRVNNRLVLNLTGGVIRIGMFVGYILLVSRMKEIRRVFMYHGAEHKAIHCFEHGQELTVENAQKFSTLHPRCGTSFLVIVMVISIIVFLFMGSNDSGPIMRILSRLALLPLVAGISYEVLKGLAHAPDEHFIIRALKWPGMQLQRLTTAPPEDNMVEVALTSLKASLGVAYAAPIPEPEAAEDIEEVDWVLEPAP